MQDLRLPGHVVEHHARLASSNAEARARVRAGADVAGLVLVADAQSAGRGRRGRTWHTVPGRSLALSMVFPQPALARPGRLTLLASVAACRALEGAGAPALSIKWPNDIMRGDKKAGGLLAEAATAPDGSTWSVLGLGVNLSLAPGDLPPELECRATDAGLPVDRARDVLADFVREMDAALAQLGSAADQARGDEYRRRAWLRGRDVTLLWRGQRRCVRIADVTREGDLVLPDGTLAPGEHVQLAEPPPG